MKTHMLGFSETSSMVVYGDVERMWLRIRSGTWKVVHEIFGRREGNTRGGDICTVMR